MADIYVIVCEVEGGVTGYRSALLKRDGVIERFDDADAAERRAVECRASAPRNSMARFRYTVVATTE